MGLAKRLNPLELSIPFMNYVARQLCHVLVIVLPTQFVDDAADSGFAEDCFSRAGPGLEPLEGGEDPGRSFGQFCCAYDFEVFFD